MVEDGKYRLKVELEGERTIQIPTPIRVDATPPSVSLISATPRVFSPDGDGRGDRVRYVYRSTEFGYPLVYVDGELTARGRHWPAGRGRAQWRARAGGGRYQPAGRYTTDLRVVDVAGNESEPTEVVPVRIRFVELVRVPRRVRVGRLLRFRVDTDAKTIAWTLGANTRGPSVRRGVTSRRAVSVRVGPTPGVYVLRVVANGHADEAVIRVVR